MIDIRNLVFTYPGASNFKLAIEELKVADKEKCCVIGPSGSGKTTLVNIITGIYKPVSGTVKVSGIEVNKRNDSEVRSFRINNIGYMFQDFGLIDYLDVEDNVLLPFYLNPVLNVDSGVLERLCYILDRLNIGNKRKSYTACLSHGEKQRVAIARALIAKPKIIIGDEATGNLDVKTTGNIMNLLMEVVKESGATLLFVTHNVSLVKYFERTIDMEKLNKALQ